MKQITILLLLVTALFAGKLNVVTSIPDIADMVREIGGARVKVKALATGREDLHAVPARPSFLPLLNRADLVLTLGLAAEHAWLPAIVRKARNPRIMPGKAGWVELSEGVTVLQKPTILDRSEGEQHPDGNPHFNIGPQEGATLARNILKALTAADPKGKSAYESNHARYLATMQAAVAKLREQGASLQGKRLVAYHEDLAYLCAFYGIEQVGAIEVKPGVPPTASHLRGLEVHAKSCGVDCIVHNQSQSNRVPLKLGKSLAAPVVEVANSVGAKKGIDSWIALQEHNLAVLLEAFGG